MHYEFKPKGVCSRNISFEVEDGIVKNGIIYGPNGSGKTNIGLAIFDIEYHLAPLKAKKREIWQNLTGIAQSTRTMS